MSRTGSGEPAGPGHGRLADHHHYKGAVRGGVPRPRHTNIGGSRGGDLRPVAAPAPNTRRPSARLVRRRREWSRGRSQDSRPARPGFETRRGRKTPLRVSDTNLASETTYRHSFSRRRRWRGRLRPVRPPSPPFSALKWAKWRAHKGLFTLYARRLHAYIAELHACVRRSTFIVVCVPFVCAPVCVCGA